jgi:hypothetical protein
MWQNLILRIPHLASLFPIDSFVMDMPCFLIAGSPNREAFRHAFFPFLAYPGGTGEEGR